jgi:hypothetical protein
MADPPPLSRGHKRAVAEISRHPSCAISGVQSTETGVLLVELEISVGFGSRLQAAGVGANGVRPIEPATLIISSDYPAGGVMVRLRPDFERHLPHMLPTPSGTPPAPCVVDEFSGDYLLRHGMSAFLDQIVLWLLKTAEDRLIDAQQGWEPTRRDEKEATFVADAQVIRDSVDPRRMGGAMKTAIWFRSSKEPQNSSPSLQALHIQCGNKLEALSPALMNDVLTDGNQGVCILCWASGTGRKIPYIDGAYRADEVQTLAALYRRAEDSGCSEGLTGQLHLLRQRLALVSRMQPLVVLVILCIRRPIKLRGQSSTVELLGYVLRARNASDLAATATTEVIGAAHIDALTPTLMRRLSDRSDALGPSWSIIGVGSVGSKIAVHMTRQGAGPAIITDNDILQPHNFARHAMLPELIQAGDPKATTDPLFTPSLKAVHVAGALATLGWSSEASILDVARANDLLGDDRPWVGDEAFVVEATASASVQERLCSSDVLGRRPRLATASLLGAGLIMKLTIEGLGGNPSAIELETVFNAIVDGDGRLAETARLTPERSVAIGQSCVSVTAAMSDARLSAMAASITEILTGKADKGLASTGSIVIGSTADDGVSRSFTDNEVGPFLRFVDAEGETRATLPRSLVEEIRTRPSLARTLRPQPLIGTITRRNRTTIIVQESDSWEVSEDGVVSRIKALRPVGLCLHGETTPSSHLPQLALVAAQDGQAIAVIIDSTTVRVWLMEYGAHEAYELSAA